MAQDFFFPDKSLISPVYSETARYLGYSKTSAPDSQITSLIQKAQDEMGKIIMPKAVFSNFDLSLQNSSENVSKPVIQFADVFLPSSDLYNNIYDCSEVFIFAATLGPQVDSFIRKTQYSDTAYASVLQATGAMYIEVFVDLLNDHIKSLCAQKGFSTKPRYSPGYGDVPLSTQKDFFRLLPCTKIGLSLMDSLIMAPEKSVTAFIGVKH